MPFLITITEEAESQLRCLSVREQRLLDAAIQTRLIHQPRRLSKAVKKLRSNPIAEFELRAGDLRALYNVEGAEVILLVIGRKVGNKLFVGNEEYDEHQDDSAKPTGGQNGGDAT